VVAAKAAGAARGVFTLLQATALSDRWHPGFYGRLNGLLTAPAMFAVAVSPWGRLRLGRCIRRPPPVFGLLAAAAVAASAMAFGPSGA